MVGLKTDLKIVTINHRKTLYIYKMMDSLLSQKYQGNIAFIVGGDDTEYLDQYKKLSNVTIVPWDGITTGLQRKDLRTNHVRALLHDINNGPTFIFEDDVTFYPDWLRNVNMALRFIEGDDFIVDLGKPKQKADKPYQTTANLQGSWGIYYSSKKIREKIASSLSFLQWHNTDVQIGKIAEHYWDINNRIIQHVGQDSTAHWGKP